MRNTKTKTLVECSLLIALSVVLSRLQFAPWPNGGSITVASMAPLVYLSIKRGWKWGLGSAFVYSLLQMLLDGISAPPVQSFFWFTMVILLDYVIAFTVLGLAGAFANVWKNSKNAPIYATLCVTGLRYLCHIISGIIIWGVYAPEGTPAWAYSLGYNGTYMIPEMIITTIVVVLLLKYVKEN